MPEDEDTNNENLELANDKGVCPELAILENKVNDNISTLKQQIVDAVSDMIKKGYQRKSFNKFKLLTQKEIIGL